MYYRCPLSHVIYLLLFLGNSKTFQGLIVYVVPPVTSAPNMGSPLIWMSRLRPQGGTQEVNQMPHHLQLLLKLLKRSIASGCVCGFILLEVPLKHEIRSREFILSFSSSSLSEKQPFGLSRHPVNETHFGCRYKQSHFVSLRWVHLKVGRSMSLPSVPLRHEQCLLQTPTSLQMLHQFVRPISTSFYPHLLSGEVGNL